MTVAASDVKDSIADFSFFGKCKSYKTIVIELGIGTDDL